VTAAHGNLFANLPSALSAEQIEILHTASGIKIERIVSHGQSSPDGFWYDQADDEWVLVTAGAATIQIEGEREPRVMKAGDYLNIPTGTRHRVSWTDPSQPTIWLAVHYKQPGGQP
jgi:cupin 2 domain-containing protein